MRLAPKAITFDAAGTIVEVRFDLAEFVLKLAHEFGIGVDAGMAVAVWVPLWAKHVNAFVRKVRARAAPDRAELWRGFFDELFRAAGGEFEQSKLRAMGREFDARAFAPEADHWRLYPDAREVLETLRARRIRMAVVSNWDASLFTVLDLVGATDYFEFALASLVEGWEKPARELFGIAVRRLGYEPFEIMHVGDNPVDDVQGARGAGLFPVLIDRDGNHAHADCVRVTKLTDLVGLYV